MWSKTGNLEGYPREIQVSQKSGSEIRISWGYLRKVRFTKGVV
jgi:hypothetical protein